MQVKSLVPALTLGGVLACGALAGWSAASAPSSELAGKPGTPPPPVPYGAAPNYRAIVAQNRAAVVSVTTEAHASQMEDQDEQDDRGDQGQGGDDSGSPFGNDPFFRYFFGQGRGRQPNQAPVHAQGSGFIIHANGIILTNAHVVHGATQVTVKLADHHEYPAKVLGMDAKTDVAVLKIDAHDLPIVRLGDPGNLAVGDYVLAIGEPYGLEETATAGIVSAKGRDLPDSDHAVPFIQTDVAVNPGNSGGPLFDATGGVVGINSEIYSRSGGFEGVSFAIPIDVATHVADQIIRTGKVEHARLGVYVQPVDQLMARSFGLDSPTGAVVSKVEPNSSAARAGLKAGDVILKYDGHILTDSGQLSAAVNMASPGDSVTLEVWREGRTQTLTAKLLAASAPGTRLASNDGPASPGRLGLSVRPLTSAERGQVGIESGLVVENVSGPAARAGIERGDVVLAVDGTPVNSVEQLHSVIAKRSTVALLIQRGDQRIFVPVQLS